MIQLQLMIGGLWSCGQGDVWAAEGRRLAVYLILLMKCERPLKSNLRLSCEFSPQPRSLALPVAAPVLEEYNYIDLRKHSRRRRIDHLVLTELPTLPHTRSESGRRARWEQSLDRYMLAKEQMQSRRGKTQQADEFEFLRLDKINRYRKIKLVEAHSLPLSIISATDLHETYSFDLDPEASRRRTHTHAHHEPARPALAPELPQQERIMNSILENYFKKKYSQPQRLRPAPKNQKYTSALLKKHKRKINP